MNNLTLEYTLIAFLGMTIHILFSILNRNNKNIPLSLGYYVSDMNNWIRLTLSILSIFALLIVSDSVADILGIKMSNGTPAKDLFALIAGYLNHSLIKNVLRIFKK
jgi:hypothetical protein